jgi:hypothetical protein
VYGFATAVHLYVDVNALQYLTELFIQTEVGKIPTN